MYVHVAMILLGLSGVLGKYVTVPAIMITFGRVVSSVAVLLPIALVKKDNLRLASKKHYLMALLGGVLVSVHWIAFFQSIQMSTVAIGVISFSTYPLFLTFLEPIVYKEKLHLKNIGVACLLLLGVGITVPEFTMNNDVTVGILWGVLSGFVYAILALVNRYLTQEHSGNIICIYQHSTAILFLFPFVITMNVVWTMQDIVGVGILGVVCTAFAMTLYVSSQKHLKAQTVGVITTLETVYGIVFALVLLGEYPSGNEIIGGTVIVGIAIYTSVKDRSIM